MVDDNAGYAAAQAPLAGTTCPFPACISPCGLGAAQSALSAGAARLFFSTARAHSVRAFSSCRCSRSSCRHACCCCLQAGSGRRAGKPSGQLFAGAVVTSPAQFLSNRKSKQSFCIKPPPK